MSSGVNPMETACCHLPPMKCNSLVVARYAPASVEEMGDATSQISSFPVVIQDLPCQLSAVFGKLSKQQDSYSLDYLLTSIVKETPEAAILLDTVDTDAGHETRNT